MCRRRPCGGTQRSRAAWTVLPIVSHAVPLASSLYNGAVRYLFTGPPRSAKAPTTTAPITSGRDLGVAEFLGIAERGVGPARPGTLESRADLAPSSARTGGGRLMRVATSLSSNRVAAPGEQGCLARTSPGTPSPTLIAAVSRPVERYRSVRGGAGRSPVDIQQAVPSDYPFRFHLPIDRNRTAAGLVHPFPPPGPSRRRAGQLYQ